MGEVCFRAAGFLSPATAARMEESSAATEFTRSQINRKTRKKPFYPHISHSRNGYLMEEGTRR